jgi:hypothetical protein
MTETKTEPAKKKTRKKKGAKSSFEPHFNGPAYEPERDHARLSNQLDRVRDFMSDGSWRTLNDIANVTGDPQASVSAQLRHLRKERFGSWLVERRLKSGGGLHEYRMLPQRRVAPGCGYGAIGCEGERIVDWSQAVGMVRSMVTKGTLKLCDQHLDKLAEEEGS